MLKGFNISQQGFALPRVVYPKTPQPLRVVLLIRAKHNILFLFSSDFSAHLSCLILPAHITKITSGMTLNRRYLTQGMTCRFGDKICL